MKKQPTSLCLLKNITISIIQFYQMKHIETLKTDWTNALKSYDGDDDILTFDDVEKLYKIKT